MAVLISTSLPPILHNLLKCHLCTEFGNGKEINKLQAVIWLGLFSLQNQIASMLSWKMLILFSFKHLIYFGIFNDKMIQQYIIVFRVGFLSSLMVMVT